MRTIRIRDEDYERLKRKSNKHDIPLVDLLSEAVRKLRGKKNMSVTDTEFDTDDEYTCDECEYDKVQEDASYCPNCGVEFDDE